MKTYDFVNPTEFKKDNSLLRHDKGFNNTVSYEKSHKQIRLMQEIEVRFCKIAENIEKSERKRIERIEQLNTRRAKR